MLFNSHIFIFVFLPVLLAGWYFFNFKKKFALAQGYLIGMSLWFYAYVNVNYLWLLLGSCVVGWGLSLLPERINSPKGRKWIIGAGCLFHLGLLGYFKYSNFFLENVNVAAGTDFSLLNIVMPVGISFYTFQQLAYLIDRCRGDAPRDTFPDYLTFMVYFPQLLQGPILLRDELIPQLHENGRRVFDAGRFSQGIQRFVLGLSKKVLLADTLAKAVNFGYSNTAGLDSISAVLLAAGYLTELYFDFSGYCDMAVGVGKMVGIEVAENFDAPFKSASVKEFWRRWHMTLGRFFTRYVYIPLGGSRRGKARTLCNVMIIMLLSGLWHGAAWTFVLWGFLHGLGMMWDNLKRWELPKKWMNQALTFAYVCLTFVFFRAESIGQGLLVIRKMFSFEWNGFLFEMAQALELPEVYIVTKALSMKLPQLLPWFWLVMLAALCAVCAVVLSGKKAGDVIEVYTAESRRESESGLAADGKRVRGSLLYRWYPFALAVLFVWSLISMTGVSEYLYFSF